MSEEKSGAAEKRIIIDEDWKAQVQAEKESAARAGPKQSDRPRPPVPPASFSLLLATLATQTLMALGALPNPATEKVETDLEQAKHLIDMMGVLEEKTRGNLTPEEKRYFDSLLFDLWLQYVEASSRAPGAGET